METQADKIAPLVVNPGRILLSTERLYFQPYNNIEPVRTDAVLYIIVIDLILYFTVSRFKN